MSGTGAPVKDTTHVEVPNFAAMQAYPVGLRKWGMRITVTDDTDDFYNTNWVLKKGFNSNNKSDNQNFIKESDIVEQDATLQAANYRAIKRIEVKQGIGATLNLGALVSATDPKLPAEAVITILIHFNAINTDNFGPPARSRGHAGTYLTRFIRTGGNFTKIGTDQNLIETNHGVAGTMTITGGTSFISAQFDANLINHYMVAFCEITFTSFIP